MGKTVVTQGNGVRAKGPMSPSPRSRPGALPPNVGRILIAGAGGFGREVLHWARDAWPQLCDRVVGFLSADDRILEGFHCDLKIIGSPDSYRSEAGDKVLLAIGVPYARRKVAESLLAQGAEFLTLVHPTAIVSPTATIGDGTIICPYAIVSDSASTGRCALVNYHASLGHDASTGDYAVLSPYATLGGNAHIGDDVFLGMHASVGPGRRVGSRSKVSANSCALTDARDDSLVFGSPGRVAPRFNVS
jgi:sugar O-acyltransferase (sialic acid O-acetyltransferase NeuD family)